MPSPFHKGNSDASIGSSARVLLAASSYPLPDKLDDVFDITGGTYNPQFSTYGWVDCGYTAAPTTFQHSVDMQRWRNEQNGEYRSVPVDWHGQIASEFLQITQANKKNLMLASPRANNASGELVTDFTARTNIPRVHVAVGFIDHLGKGHVSIFPNAAWNGGAINQEIGRGAAIRIPMTWDIYPLETLTGADGNAVFRYDIDQP